MKFGHPESHLANYAGIPQADAVAGFGWLKSPDRAAGPFSITHGMTHARWYVFELADIDQAACSQSKTTSSKPVSLIAYTGT